LIGRLINRREHYKTIAGMSNAYFDTFIIEDQANRPFNSFVEKYYTSDSKIGLDLVHNEPWILKMRMASENYAGRSTSYEYLLENPENLTIGGKYLKLTLNLYYAPFDIVKTNVVVKRVAVDQFKVTISENADTYTAVGLVGTFTFTTDSATPDYLLMNFMVGVTQDPVSTQDYFTERLYKYKFSMISKAKFSMSHTQVFKKTFSPTGYFSTNLFINHNQECVDDVDQNNCLVAGGPAVDMFGLKFSSVTQLWGFWERGDTYIDLSYFDTDVDDIIASTCWTNIF
jgi:hypothetical protein